jgi:hypothetical protein
MDFSSLAWTNGLAASSAPAQSAVTNGFNLMLYSSRRVFPSSFWPQMRWLRAFTRITDDSQRIGIHTLAASLRPE